MDTALQDQWSGRIKSPPGILLLVWLAVLVFLTLYPWSGWRTPIAGSWQFLFDIWPRYWTGFDVVTNIVAYLPLGMLLVLVMAKPINQNHTGLSFLLLIFMATFCGSTISLLLEGLQSWLPQRIPSRLDWLTNSVGTATGAGIAAITIWRLEQQFLANLSLGRPATQPQLSWSVLTPGRLSIGLLALAVWLVIQTHPQRLLFASGDISGLLANWFEFELPSLNLDQIAFLEPLIVAAQMCIVGSVVWTAISHPLGRRLCLVVSLIGGLLIKSIAYRHLAPSAEPLWWLTAGAQGGLLIGGTCLALMTTLKPQTQNSIAFLLLIGVTTIANFAPDNPFFDTMIDNWDTGRLGNLHALIETFSVLWPILVLTYLWLARLAYNRKYV